VCSSDSARAAAGAFSEVAGHLDVLINNAGVYPDQGLTVLTLPRARLGQTVRLRQDQHPLVRERRTEAMELLGPSCNGSTFSLPRTIHSDTPSFQRLDQQRGVVTVEP
jgi:NAD(P)-dependent dehydrogenase (short-subunit alcohol dehydrogenase family)